MAVDSELRQSNAPVVEKPQPLNQSAKSNEMDDLNKGRNAAAADAGHGYPSIDDIADKFRSHIVIPVVDESTGHSEWTALVPASVITEHGISVDTINGIISSKSQWNAGDVVTDSVCVRAKIGTRGLVLSALQPDDRWQQNTWVHLDESGSSANVSLIVAPNGALRVHKTCSHDGIDENGRPWLERQNRFLETSIAVQETDLFVKPLRHTAADGHFSIDFPYLASQTLAQLAMAGMGGGLLLDVTSALLGEMAQKVWPRTATAAPADFIERAHFDRIDRRVAIARAALPELGAIVDSDEVVLNGRRLLGLGAVMARLRGHPAIADVSPTLIGEIHGDLNLHNILCCAAGESGRRRRRRRRLALIDPRGVHLLGAFAEARDFEPGDYAYDLSKLKFSLSAFSEIRHGGLLKLQRQGGAAAAAFTMTIGRHAGSETMRQADAGFFDALAGNADLMEWVGLVEQQPAAGGLEALRRRVLLGEAANFVADAACALGRDAAHEVVPLFLIGLAKLNGVLAALDGGTVVSGRHHEPGDWFSQGGGGEQDDDDAAAGVMAVQRALLRPSRGAASLWDVLEISVPSRQVAVTERLLETLRGKCFPARTAIYNSASAAVAAGGVAFPCVLLHGISSSSSHGPTDAVLAAAAAANAFLERSGVSGSARDALRVISVQSGTTRAAAQQTAAAAAALGFARRGSPLLAPGPWGASPLQLLLLTAQQLRFARGGRWILDDRSCFVLGRELAMPAAADVCVLTCAPPPPPQTALPAALDKARRPGSTTDGQRLMGKRKNSVVPSGGGAVFLSADAVNKLTQEASKQGAARPRGDIFTDAVFPAQGGRDAWAELYRSRGFGGDEDAAWEAAQRLSTAVGGGIEHVYGGDKVSVYRFGTLEEYKSLTERAKSDPALNSLAFLAAALRWSEQVGSG